MEDRPLVLLTPGDPNGIGPECLLKAWDRIFRLCRPVVVGAVRPLAAAADAADIGVEFQLLTDLWDACPSADRIALLPVEGTDIEPRWGVVDRRAGEASFRWLELAVRLCLEGESRSLVTGPISKRAWALAGIPYAGHTGYLAERCGVAGKEAMAFVSPKINVVLATTHIPLAEVSRVLTAERITHVTLLFRDFLQKQLNREPRLALCGLNPHAGDSGVIGDEEERIVIPAAEELRDAGVDIAGPLAADTLFTPKNLERYDGFVALYHDQGLIPVKLLDFDRAVNVTLGLPFLRTSPSHGTAFDIAGRGVARAESLLAAVRCAVTS